MENINILIVEDELIIYMHITQTLKALGFKNIHVARNSNDAISHASNTKIDLLFSDIKIDGDVDGIDTAFILQNLYSLPVIFITAYKDKDILKRAAKIDTIGYLLKPFRVDELEALIELSIEKFDLRTKTNEIKYKEYIYSLKTNELKLENEIIYLTKKEKLFVSLLFSNIESIIAYDIIDDVIWHKTYVSENTRRTFIYRFKNKFPKFNIKIEKNIGIGLYI